MGSIVSSAARIKKEITEEYLRHGLPAGSKEPTKDFEQWASRLSEEDLKVLLKNVPRQIPFNAYIKLGPEDIWTTQGMAIISKGVLNLYYMSWGNDRKKMVHGYQNYYKIKIAIKITPQGLLAAGRFLTRPLCTKECEICHSGLRGAANGILGEIRVLPEII